VDQEPRFEFRKKAQYAWKVAMLVITFLALIPILLYQHELGAKAYLWFLIGVHVLGLLIFSIGVQREDIAPSRRGLYGRVAGLVTIVALLYLASKGLATTFGTALFWWSLFLVWAIHTLGLALLHIRGRREVACPFV